MARPIDCAACGCCGKKYRVCCFNRHHQKFCTRKACVRRRRQERQREHYGRKYRDDKSFADAERQRCKKSIQERRKNARNAAGAVFPDDGVRRIQMNVEHLTAGLLSQWIDSKDPIEVEEAARRLEKRGQQLTLATRSLRGPPIMQDF